MGRRVLSAYAYRLAALLAFWVDLDVQQNQTSQRLRGRPEPWEGTDGLNVNDKEARLQDAGPTSEMQRGHLLASSFPWLGGKML